MYHRPQPRERRGGCEAGPAPRVPGGPGPRRRARSAAAGAAPCLRREGKKSEKGVNRVCSCWEMYLVESKEITSPDRRGFIPLRMVLICFRLDPFMSRGGEGYLPYSADPRANPHAEPFLRTHLRPHRSLSGFPFSRNRRRERLNPSRAAHGPPSPPRSQTALRDPPPPPQLRSHGRRNRSGGGAAPARPPPRRRDRPRIPALPERPGLRRDAPRRKSPFLCRKEKLTPPYTPRVYSTASDLVEGGAGGREQEEGWLRRGGSRAANKSY